MTEVIDTFPCFGSTCAVVVDAGDDEAAAHDSVAAARRRLLGWHDAFSRFVPTSELSRLNADPRSEVPVSPLMGRLVEAIADAARADRRPRRRDAAARDRDRGLPRRPRDARSP